MRVLVRAFLVILLGVAVQASGDMTQDDAEDFFAAVRNHAVENIAMATTLVRSGAQKIVDVALAAAQTGINKLVGFVLV